MLPITKRNEVKDVLKKRKYNQVQDDIRFEKPYGKKWTQKEDIKMQELLLNQYLAQYKIDFPKEFSFRSLIKFIFIFYY